MPTLGQRWVKLYCCLGKLRPTEPAHHRATGMWAARWRTARLCAIWLGCVEGHPWWLCSISTVCKVAVISGRVVSIRGCLVYFTHSIIDFTRLHLCACLISIFLCLSTKAWMAVTSQLGSHFRPADYFKIGRRWRKSLLYICVDDARMIRW